MTQFLIRSLVASLVLTGSVSALAKKNCTDQPRDKWMSEEAFKTQVEALGYKISKFKQPGTCYEIYGTDKAGRKVEIYFNPMDASIVKQK